VDDAHLHRCESKTEERLMTMRHLAGAAVAASLLGATGAGAVTTENFQVKDTQDLVDLCAVQRGDAVAVQAIHFCQGYLIGVYHYHQALTSGRGQRAIFCPTGPLPTRDEAVSMFVTWGRAHPQYMSEPAVDGLFRWAVETWPCPRTNRQVTR
jgi:hypothetical protein